MAVWNMKNTVVSYVLRKQCVGSGQCLVYDFTCVQVSVIDCIHFSVAYNHVLDGFHFSSFTCRRFKKSRINSLQYLTNSFYSSFSKTRLTTILNISNFEQYLNQRFLNSRLLKNTFTCFFLYLICFYGFFYNIVVE